MFRVEQATNLCSSPEMCRFGYTISTHYLHTIYTLSRADGDGQMVTAAVKMMERRRYGDNLAIKL